MYKQTYRLITQSNHIKNHYDIQWSKHESSIRDKCIISISRQTRIVLNENMVFWQNIYNNKKTNSNAYSKRGQIIRHIYSTIDYINKLSNQKTTVIFPCFLKHSSNKWLNLVLQLVVPPTFIQYFWLDCRNAS